MENEDSNQQEQRREKGKNNPVTSRRVWKKKEEDVLMAAMIELIGRSGVMKMKDSNARGFRDKEFPYFDNWCVLFGKDRATGELAEGPAEALASMNEEEFQTYDDPFATPLPTEMDTSVNGTTSMQARPYQGRKRSCSDGISVGLTSLAEQFGNLVERTDCRMGELAQRIGYAQDLSEARKMVHNELKKMPLESGLRLKAASMIVKDDDKADLFFSLSEEERSQWVLMLLQGLI